MPISKKKIISIVMLTIGMQSLVVAAGGEEFKTLPGSDKKYTDKQINDFFNVPDWYPDKRPEMPPVVKNGSKPSVFACASCHLVSGSGHPESSALSGLPSDYMFRQLKAYQRFQRSSLAGVMINIARGMSDEQMKQASDYFAALTPRNVQKVIEVDEVPKTYVNKRFMTLKLDGNQAGMEPIGERIISVPRDEYRVKARDPFETFITYVPVGSIEKGKKIVNEGLNGTASCISCHGADLKGTPVGPPIAGQHASYLFSQLRDYKSGVRRGGADMNGIMAANLKFFKDEEILAVVAYLASLDR